MASFGKESERNVSECHPDLQKVLRLAIKIFDFKVLCGLRNEDKQQQAVIEKRSKAEYPKSNHNRSKKKDGSYDYTQSDAADCVPWPIQWPDIRKQTTKEYVKRMGQFYFMAGVILACAFTLGVKLRWGGHFKSFFDGPHFERVVS